MAADERAYLSYHVEVFPRVEPGSFHLPVGYDQPTPVPVSDATTAAEPAWRFALLRRLADRFDVVAVGTQRAVVGRGGTRAERAACSASTPVATAASNHARTRRGPGRRTRCALRGSARWSPAGADPERGLLVDAVAREVTEARHRAAADGQHRVVERRRGSDVGPDRKVIEHPPIVTRPRRRCTSRSAHRRVRHRRLPPRRGADRGRAGLGADVSWAGRPRAPRHRTLLDEHSRRDEVVQRGRCGLDRESSSRRDPGAAEHEVARHQVEHAPRRTALLRSRRRPGRGAPSRSYQA